jgi:hypothetical protein
MATKTSQREKTRHVLFTHEEQMLVEIFAAMNPPGCVPRIVLQKSIVF